MSNNITPLNTVLVKDTTTVLKNHRDFAILKSGNQISWKQYTSTSVSQSAIQFSCPPPSGGVIVDRKQYFYLPARLYLTGTPPNGQAVLQPGRDAPRAFPISGGIDTYSISINNETVSIQMADIIHALVHYNTDAKLKQLDYSMTPTCLDQSQQYGDLFGTIRSPLGGYGDSGDGNVTMGRGGFPYVIVSNPVQASSGTPIPLTAIVDIAPTEPIFLSPFYFGHGNGSGFYNVNTMDFNITFLGASYLANRWWSHDNTSPTGALTCSISWASLITSGPAYSFNSQPYMFFKYITPLSTDILGPKMSLAYPYFDVQRYPTDLNSTVAAGASVEMNSNNLQISSIPRRLYIYIRQRNADLYNSCSQTDTYFRIDRISIQFLNKNGLLASASAQQLYNMSVANHCNMSWSQWYGTSLHVIGPSTITPVNGIGSILCIEFARDIGLDELQAPGKLEQCMLQCTVNATNLSASGISPSLYIIPVLDGVFNITGLGSASKQVGVITANDILNAKEQSHYSWKEVEEVNGGDFFSGIKEFFTEKVLPLIKQSKIASNLARLIPGVGPEISNSLYNLGYGEGEGGVLVGGEGRMSKMNLRRRLQQK